MCAMFMAEDAIKSLCDIRRSRGPRNPIDGAATVPFDPTAVNLDPLQTMPHHDGSLQGVQGTAISPRTRQSLPMHAVTRSPYFAPLTDLVFMFTRTRK